MLSRQFALIGFPIAVLAAALLIGSYHFVVLANLKSSVEAVAASMAQIFANTLWHDYGSLVAVADGMDAAAIRTDPRTERLDAEVRKIAAGTRVLKVKVYSLRGITLYSTDPAQIGSNYWDESNYQAALAGDVASRLTRKATFQAIAGPRTDLVVLESYIPARVPADTGRIIAVLEIYSDVTDLEAGILQRPEAVGAMLLVVAVLLAAFGTQLWVLRRAEHRWLDEQAQRLKLSAEYAIEFEASRAKSAFLAGMSHELRTPLNAIIGFSELLRIQAFGPLGQPRYVEYAEDIHGAGRHLLGVIGNVLDLSRIEAGKTEVSWEAVDPVEVVRSALDMLNHDAEDRNIVLRRTIEPGIPSITSDAGKLRQVVLNIVSNSIKYSRPGGAVDVGVSFDAARRGVRLVISDNGIGMTEHGLDIALTPFGRVPGQWSQPQPGTGLGLPLAKRTVEILGGEFQIASAPGIGTTVTIWLPADAKAHRTTDSLARGFPADLGSRDHLV
ncbi:HAMP domain-containing sensor histidine kinase [Thalassobaculum sp.]|uniref:sensor histidine kinase n=1 Tax=Thalassobaculum sp. TaxID=2022740 RepID=UPI0032EE40DF